MSIWGDPEQLAAKGGVLERHCDDLGRDPSTIKRSANALLFLSEDDAWVNERRGMDVGPTAAIVGPPAEVVEIVAAYQEAGVDELIIPDFNLPDPGAKRETMDLFMEEVVRVLAPTA